MSASCLQDVALKSNGTLPDTSASTVHCMAALVLACRLSAKERAAVQAKVNNAHLTARMMPLHMMGLRGDSADIPEELLAMRLGAQVGCVCMGLI
jgi:hypothetical protein